MTHYHNDSLECIIHADEYHFVQDEDTFCFACAVVPDRAPEKTSLLSFLRQTDETILVFNEPYIEKRLAQSNISRAPPLLV